MRLRSGESGTEPAEDLHPASRTVEDIFDARDSLCVHGRGHPEGWHGTYIHAPEACGRHAHDRHRVVVDRDLPADDINSASELRLPEAVGEHDDLPSTGGAIIVRFEDAAERGLDAEDREIAAGDEFGGDRSWIAAGREIHGTDLGAADDAVEDTGLMLGVSAERVRHQVEGTKAAGHMFAFPVDEDEALGLADWECVEDQLVDE